MFFSLEALHAKHGDSLLLRFGDGGKPRLIVIDGGPSGVYKAALRPRLEQLQEAAGETLPIEILMVSHIDSDHINGVLEFSRELLKDPERQSKYRVRTLWANSFDDEVKAVNDAAPASIVPAGLEAREASVAESRTLRDNARGLDWPEHKGFDGLVMAPDDKGVKVDLDPLKLTVIGPRQVDLDALQNEWVKEIAKLKKEGKIKPASVEKLDKSPPNLSSIVCVAELGGKRMLLTGDAQGPKVLEGLEAAGFLKPGEAMDVDLLKLPHHGSSYNNTLGFLERVRAPHIVISADGKDDNPDLPTLERLSKARPDDDFTIHFTESDFVDGVGDKIKAFFAKEKAAGRKYEVEFTPADELLRLDLLDPLD
ncbi:MAG TPA: hypothetical protein VFJ57_09965 [Solirubrobacterales bacterium]|nr:hypothetical protein [Solirubrobacterales bacterium]